MADSVCVPWVNTPSKTCVPHITPCRSNEENPRRPGSCRRTDAAPADCRHGAGTKKADLPGRNAIEQSIHRGMTDPPFGLSCGWPVERSNELTARRHD